MSKLVANNKLIGSTTEIEVEEGGEEELLEETDGITTKETKVKVTTATTFVINIQTKVRGEANTKVIEGGIVTMIIEVEATLTYRVTMTEDKWAAIIKRTQETEEEAVTNIQEEVEEVEEGEVEVAEAVKIEVVVTVILVSGATLHTMMLLNDLVATPVHNQVP